MNDPSQKWPSARICEICGQTTEYVMTPVDAYWETIEYIHSNPVRRGLCDSETDWPWSSAGVFFGVSDGPLGLDLQSLPDDPRGC